MKHPSDLRFFKNEAYALISRLNSLKPFSLNTPMVRAAAISDAAYLGIERLLAKVSRELRQSIQEFLLWLKQEGAEVDTDQVQQRYAELKMKFNFLLDKLDIFGDVLTQRGEHETGVWLAGLDVLARDALQLSAQPLAAPPLICFVERGHGAAIRRARTRLPGGETNPVAVIQVPRERMVGSGIGSSLVHEVGHQGAALLDLVESLRAEIAQVQQSAEQPLPWQLFQHWISEIIADFWATAHLGISATTGLMGVVSLPRYFVFRIGLEGPHPFPWIRVKTSCALGNALFPHPQWQHWAQRWERMYPLEGLDEQKLQIIQALEQALPAFAELVVNHRPAVLNGQALGEIFYASERMPDQLLALYREWNGQFETIKKTRPTLAFAVIGQAKAAGLLSAKDETDLLQRLLTQWAWERSDGKHQLNHNLITF
ncbi:hypothetical protein [Haliscomenobacter sp.]|uniref:hypothetical protein n=1 Tax=Haliscomenobacter sp. TaxID=2717303 RepID=UPI0035946FD3